MERIAITRRYSKSHRANNHGALHDGTGTEDCNVRLVDDQVSNSAPKEPMLVMVRSNPTAPRGDVANVRARPPRSPIAFARPAMPRSEAFLMTGTSRCPGVSQQQRCSRSVVEVICSLRSWKRSERVLLQGPQRMPGRRRARKVSFAPSRAAKPSLAFCTQLNAMRVTSTSVTWVSWVEISRDSRIRFAITWRIRAVFSTVPRGKPRGVRCLCGTSSPEQQLQQVQQRREQQNP